MTPDQFIAKWKVAELKERSAAQSHFIDLCRMLRGRGHPSETVAHFINRLVFCMFAEDVDLLPNKMFKRMLEHTIARPHELQTMASELFRAMKAGGRIGFEQVAWFNGGLFNDDTALPLDKDDIRLAACAAPSEDQSNRMAAIERVKTLRLQCFAKNALALDDYQSDAATIGKAVASACSSGTAALVALVNQNNPAAGIVLYSAADDEATQTVLISRRMRQTERK